MCEERRGDVISLRCWRGEGWIIVGGGGAVDGAAFDRVVDLLLDALLGCFADYGADLCGFVERVAEFDFRQDFLHSIHKVIVNTFMNVNPFECAARLSGIKDAAIDNLLRRPCNIDILSHISWIIPTQLQTYSTVHSSSCSLLDSDAVGDRAGEAHELDFWGLDEFGYGGEGAGVEVLYDTFWQTGFEEDLLYLFGDCGGLGRRFED